MVVLATSVTTSDGKVLVSRQFVDMTKTRVEGLLAAFAKLVGLGEKTHTFVETSSVRYVYQRLEGGLYMIIVTNKSSNIVEDLELLQILSKVVPEFCGEVSEEAVKENCFELVFAFDELVSLGYSERITLAQLRTFTEMDSHEERMAEIAAKNKEREAAEEMKKRIKEMERERKEREKLGLSSMSGMGSRSMGSMGSMGGGSMGGMGGGSPHIESRTPPAYACLYAISFAHGVSIQKAQPAPQRPQRSGMKLGSKATAGASGFMEQLAKEGEVTRNESPSHPGSKAPVEASAILREPVEVSIVEQMQVSFDREGALNQMIVQGEFVVDVTSEHATRNRIVTSNKGNLQFRIHPNVHRQMFLERGVLTLKDEQTAYRLNTPTSVLKWRQQSTNEDDVPLRVHCWPSVGGDGKVLANIEYDLEHGHDVSDFVLTVPIVGKSAPVVTLSDGSHSFDTKANVLTWSIPVINGDNAHGTMDVEVAQWDNSGDTNWLFPITVTFTGRTTIATISVDAVEGMNGESLANRVVKELRVDRYVVGERL